MEHIIIVFTPAYPGPSTERLDHPRLGERGVALVQGKIGLHRLERAVEGEPPIALKRREMVLVEIARVIGVAAL